MLNSTKNANVCQNGENFAEGTHLFFIMHRKAIISLIGGMLIHLTLGAVYTTSNIVTYVISYLHVVKHQAVINHYFHTYL